MTLRTLNYGNYGIFLIMGNAGFCPSTVGSHVDVTCIITRTMSMATFISRARGCFVITGSSMLLSQRIHVPKQYILGPQSTNIETTLRLR